jgi:hypothetical protein
MKKLRRGANQTSKAERSVNPEKGHMLKLCVCMERVSPFLQVLDKTTFYPCNSLVLDYPEDGGRKLQNVGS